MRNCVLKMWKTKTNNTMTAPKIIIIVGFSSITSQTQKGPITISKSIIKLTIAEDVNRGARLKHAKEIGKIIIPIASNVQIGAINIPSRGLK